MVLLSQRGQLSAIDCIRELKPTLLVEQRGVEYLDIDLIQC